MIPQKQLKNAKLYSTRDDFITTLPKKISYLEAGVLAGDFSLQVIEACSPLKVYLVDTFEEIDWRAREFGGARWKEKSENFDFVKKRFENIPEVKLFKTKFKNFCYKNKESFDFVYIDFDTRYLEVIEQLSLGSKILNTDGILGFNDYNIYENDTTTGQKMGVVPAINEFLYKNPDWYVHAFAFNDNLTSDIYLKRS